MKRLIISSVMALFCIAIYAQKDVTTFLGIPIDGFKSEMKQKLIAKGYSPKKFGNMSLQRKVIIGRQQLTKSKMVKLYWSDYKNIFRWGACLQRHLGIHI